MGIDNKSGNIFGELVLTAIILYFAWQAAPMIDYSQRLAHYMVADDEGLFSHIMGYIYRYGGNSLLALTILLPLSAFLPSADSEDNDGMAFFVILWAFLGWWVGSSFEEAYTAQIACKKSSTFGFGCTLNGPLISHLAYCTLGIIITLSTGLSLLAVFFGQSENEEGNRQQ